MRRARKTKRKDGLTAAEARAEMGVRVRPAVLLPDGRVIDERRARERRRDGSTPIWVPALSVPLRVRFPDGTLVSGPFRATGHGVWHEGEGVVSWKSQYRWAVPESAIPVRVTIGNRHSGGYFPEELTIIGESADPEPVPAAPAAPEPRESRYARPCVVCREPARWGRVCDSCRKPLDDEDESLVLDEEILDLLQGSGFTP